MNNKEKNFVSAVIYFHNSVADVQPCIQTVWETLRENFEHYEIICVDDGSSDDTVSAIKQTVSGMESTSVTIIKMNKFQGTEAAMSAGVNLAIGDYVFEFDRPVMDFNKELIMQIYRKSLEGFDIVSASNRLYKKCSSRIFYNIFNKNANLQNNIQSENFRIISRRAINKVYSMGKFIKYRKALYANCGLACANITYEGNQELLSKYETSSDYKTETAMTSLILFTNFAYKVSFAFSVIMMLATVFMGIYTVVTFLTKNAIEGFTTTMLVMTGSFFAVFLLFAIVIKYLSVIVQLVFNEQEYFIESIEKN